MPNTKSPSLENPAQTLKKENTILRELTNASIILALVTSLLYISGATYLNSYLIEWGVEPSLITSNTQQVLIQGASIWFVGGVYILIPAFLIGIVLFPPFHMVLELSKSPLVRKITSIVYKALKSKEKEELEPPLILQSTNRFLRQFLILILFLSIFMFIFYKILEFSSSQGEERAKKEYIEFSTGKVISDAIFTQKKFLNINGVEMEGYVLAGSNSLVALYLPATRSKEEEVVIVQLNSVSNIKALKTHNVTTAEQ